MAELVFFSGTMDYGKSTLALQMDHNHRARQRVGLIFTKLDRMDEDEQIYRASLRISGASNLIEVWIAIDQHEARELAPNEAHELLEAAGVSL